MIKRALCLLLLIAFLAPAPAEPQSGLRALPVLLEVDPSVDEQLARVTFEIILLELQVQGVAAARAEAAAMDEETASLRVALARDGESLQVTMSLGGPLDGTYELESAVGLGLERRVRSLLARIVAEHPELIAPEAPPPSDALPPSAGRDGEDDAVDDAEEEPGNGEEAVGTGVADDDGNPAGAGDGSPAPASGDAATGASTVSDTADAAQAVGATTLPSMRGGLQISAAFSSLVPLGDAARYFSVLAGPSVFVGFSLSESPLSLGLSGGASFARAAGASVSAESFVVPLSLEGRLAFAAYPLEAGLRLAGGVALIGISVPNALEQTLLVPMVDAGVTTQFFFSSVLGVIVEISFVVYIERSIPIMGIRPSLGLMLSF